MIRFFLLVIPSLALTTADLSPPFEADENGNVGNWEIGGSAAIFSDKIILVPPIQFRQGLAWTQVEIPSGAWDITYNMTLHEGNGGGGFAFWFTNKYGANGPIYGGPANFKGLCLIASIKPDNALSLIMVQQNGKGMLSINELPHADKVVQYVTGKPFELKISFKGGMVKVFYNDKLVIQQELTVNLAKRYIGVTAGCRKHFTRIDMNDVYFGLEEQEEIETHEQTIGDNKANAEIENTEIYELRNPVFNVTQKELEKFEDVNKDKLVIENTTEASAITVLDVIDEINAASFDVASYSELNEFIQDNMLPYTQKWQRRTLKIVERVQKARDVAGVAMKSTQELLNLFNTTLIQKVFKTSDKIISLTEFMNDVASKGVDEDGEMEAMVNYAKSSKAIQIISICTILEMIILVAFLIITRFSFVKRRLMGTNEF